MTPKKVVFVAFLLLVEIALVLSSDSISCKDEDGNPVDWFIILKAPEPNGFSYSYADSNSPQLQMSTKELDDGYEGALGQTLKQIYDNSKSDDVGYLLYNDESPDGEEHDSNGHTKGDMCFDSTQGYWLVHSVPRFPAVASGYYNYPHNESIYGQSFLCMTFSTSTLNEIGNQLLVNKPFVYDSNLPDALAGVVPNLNTVLQDSWVTSATNQSLEIVTLEGTNFVSFAKNKEWNGFLYEQFIEPYYDSGMLVETWMDGAKANQMPTFCKPSFQYDSINVREVSFPNSGPSFAETKDHSKWTISSDIDGIVCIGDINRQYSQSKRGGGTVCFKNMGIFKSFQSLITKSDQC